MTIVQNNRVKESTIREFLGLSQGRGDAFVQDRSLERTAQESIRQVAECRPQRNDVVLGAFSNREYQYLQSPCSSTKKANRINCEKSMSIAILVQNCLDYDSDKKIKKEAVQELSNLLIEMQEGKKSRSRVHESVKSKLANPKDPIFEATFSSAVKGLFESVFKHTDPKYTHFIQDCWDYKSRKEIKKKAVLDLRNLLEEVGKREKKPIDILIHLKEKLDNPDNDIFKATFSSSLKDLFNAVYTHVKLTEVEKAKELHSTGNTFYRDAQYEKALSFYSQSYRLRRDLCKIDAGIIEELTPYEISIHSDNRSIAECYRKIGDEQKIQGNLELAFEYYKKSFKIQNRTTSSVAVEEKMNMHDGAIFSGLCIDIGDRYKARGDFENALVLYDQAWEVSQPDSLNHFVFYQRVGDVYKDQGKSDTALDKYKFVVRNRENLPGSEGLECLLNCYKGIAEVMSKQNHSSDVSAVSIDRLTQIGIIYQEASEIERKIQEAKKTVCYRVV